MGDLATGYDLLMVLWGTVFIIAAAGFLYAMNRVFVQEERRQEGLSPAPVDSALAPRQAGGLGVSSKNPLPGAGWRGTNG